MEYTIAQLETQLRIAKNTLSNYQLQRIEIECTFWQLAIDYGEDVRISHLLTVNNCIKYTQNKITNLMLQINGK
jgi:hypothetical protein